MLTAAYLSHILHQTIYPAKHKGPVWWSTGTHAMPRANAWGEEMKAPYLNQSIATAETVFVKRHLEESIIIFHQVWPRPPA